jgi:hypothetical protein
MAAMLVGALRRGSGCGGGSLLLAQSLRRFVSSPSSPILLAFGFGPFSSVRPTQPGGWWWRCSATTLDALNLSHEPASHRDVGIGSPVVGLAPDQAT